MDQEVRQRQRLNSQLILRSKWLRERRDHIAVKTSVAPLRPISHNGRDLLRKGESRELNEFFFGPE